MVKWIVSVKVADENTVSHQATWPSRANTEAEAIAEASAVLGVPKHQLEVTAWGSIDWSDSSGPVDPLAR